MGSKNIIQLRQLLSQRFPHLRPFEAAGPTSDEVGRCFTTGIDRLDQLLDGGLPKGAISELVGGEANAGSASLILQILSRTDEVRHWMALIDGQDSFDPTPLDPSILSRLLWVRCHNAQEALKAADLLLRDGNLPLVFLDLQLNSAAQLRKIPSTTWFRLQRILEQTSTALLVITPHPMVSNAEVRFTMRGRFTLDSLTQTQDELIEHLDVQLLQKRGVFIGAEAESQQVSVSVG